MDFRPVGGVGVLHIDSLELSLGQVVFQDLGSVFLVHEIAFDDVTGEVVVVTQELAELVVYLDG